MHNLSTSFCTLPTNRNVRYHFNVGPYPFTPAMLKKALPRVLKMVVLVSFKVDPHPIEVNPATVTVSPHPVEVNPVPVEVNPVTLS